MNKQIMGILNVTPDSFSDGGEFFDVQKAVARGIEMAREGADMIDVGGESSRPGSVPVSAEEEKGRVVPVIEQLSKMIDVPISIDTYKPEVAEAALEAGASIINDITGLRNEAMVEVATKQGAGVVIMHMQGTPKTMQENPEYGDVVRDILEWLKRQVLKARAAGIENVMVDPGIGFGKTLEHNVEILRRLGEFRELGCPVLIGPSRKSFLGKLTGAEVDGRLGGSIGAALVAAFNGADILRVHDVKETKQALEVAEAIYA